MTGREGRQQVQSAPHLFCKAGQAGKPTAPLKRPLPGGQAGRHAIEHRVRQPSNQVSRLQGCTPQACTASFHRAANQMGKGVKKPRWSGQAEQNRVGQAMAGTQGLRQRHSG